MEQPPQGQCPECGSKRIAWHVHHAACRGARGSVRSLGWQCRACSRSWTEPIRAEPAEVPLSVPA